MKRACLTALRLPVDCSLATHLTAVSVEWCQSGKGGNLFAVKWAEFRHRNEQR